MSEDRLPSRNPAPLGHATPLETGIGRDLLPHKASSGDPLPFSGAEVSSRESAPLQLRLREATTSGNTFELLRARYSDTDGDWTTIRSDDPFEVLYLDHEAWETISVTLIEERYASLRMFWDDVLRRMSSGAARQQITEKYGGESALRTYPNRLDDARRLLATEQGIRAEHERLEASRDEKATALLLRSLAPLLAAGSIAPASLQAIAARLEAYGFRPSAGGVVLQGVLRARHFAPAREIVASTAAEVASVRWSTTAADRMEEIRHSDVYMRMGVGRYNPSAPNWIGDLTPSLVAAAYRERVDWWRNQSDVVAVGTDRCTSAEALERIEIDRTKLLSDLSNATAVAPTRLALLSTIASPPFAVRRTTSRFAGASVILAIGVMAWLTTKRSSAPGTGQDVASPSHPERSAEASDTGIPQSSSSEKGRRPQEKITQPQRATATSQRDTPLQLTAVINDTDGYTNVRRNKSASSEIVAREEFGEEFHTFRSKGDWWEVKTSTGQIGYMHVSRITIKR